MIDAMFFAAAAVVAMPVTSQQNGVPSSFCLLFVAAGGRGSQEACG